MGGEAIVVCAVARSWPLSVFQTSEMRREQVSDLIKRPCERLWAHIQMFKPGGEYEAI